MFQQPISVTHTNNPTENLIFQTGQASVTAGTGYTAVTQKQTWQLELTLSLKKYI
jgi:hypothetical protein